MAAGEVKVVRRLTESTRWRKQASELGALCILQVLAAGPNALGLPHCWQ
jgi:hypothetical protein